MAIRTAIESGKADIWAFRRRGLLTPSEGGAPCDAYKPRRPTRRKIQPSDRLLSDRLVVSRWPLFRWTLSIFITPLQTRQFIPINHARATGSRRLQYPLAILLRNYKVCEDVLYRGIFLIQPKSDYSRALSESDDESEDSCLPPLDVVFQTRFPTNASAKPSKPERNRPYIEKPLSDATGTHLDHTRLGVGVLSGGSQGRCIGSRELQPAANDPQTSR